MSLSPDSVQTVRDRSDSVTVEHNRCPICKQRITSRVEDPSTAETAKRFLQLKHATDPEAYHAATKKHPVRRNVLSRVAAREVLTDFVSHLDENMNDNYENGVKDSSDWVMIEINAGIHRDWLAQQFRRES